jgi:hypothetical protein
MGCTISSKKAGVFQATADPSTQARAGGGTAAPQGFPPDQGASPASSVGALVGSGSSANDVFGSMRFGAAHGVEPMARELQVALGTLGTNLHIIDMHAGGDINIAVFSAIEACDTFLVFGSAKYGEDTGNQACTYNEYQHAFSQKKRIILIRMIPFDQQYEELQGRYIFGANKLVLPWVMGSPMPPDLPAKIMEAIGLTVETPPPSSGMIHCSSSFTHAAAVTTNPGNGDGAATGESSFMLWVGNIPSSCATEAALLEALRGALTAEYEMAVGDSIGVKNCTVRAKPDKRNGSWALVAFDDEDSMERAQLVEVVVDGEVCGDDGVAEAVKLEIKPAKVEAHIQRNERRAKRELRERRQSIELGLLAQVAQAHQTPGGQFVAPEQAALSVGDAVEVFSQSKGAWLAGKVTSIDANLAFVEYGGNRSKVVDFTSATFSDECRVLTPQEEDSDE